VLPELEPFGGLAVEPHGDYDAVAFDGVDLSEQNAANASFLDCRLDRCRADGLLLRRARLVEILVTDLQAVSIDLTESVWRDTLVAGGRIGAVLAPGATLTRVGLRGVKLDFVNLRGAELRDVVFEDCVVGELDLTGAAATDVAFPGSRLDDLNVGGATLERVDVSDAELRSLRGLESLRGAVVNPDQLHDLAPLLAEHLGLTVRGD
jgi:uncharacterized protein YjbI with pentapeptide repeats